MRDDGELVIVVLSAMLLVGFGWVARGAFDAVMAMVQEATAYFQRRKA